ncbi:hypothetical protein C1N58_02470 [Pantoea sp. SGAir0180]
MAKKTQVEILVHKAFLFTSPKGEQTPFLEGRYNVDKDVADHWFVAAHSTQTGGTSTSGSDEELQGQIDSLKTELDEKAKTIVDLNEQIEAKDKANSVLLEQLEAAQKALKDK